MLQCGRNQGAGRSLWTGAADLEAGAGRLRAYGAALWRARFWLAAWLAAWLVAGAAYVALLPAQYVANVEIAIAPQAVANDGPEDVRHFHQFDLDAEQAETELWIMGSDRVTRRVFDGLQLADLPELQSGRDGLLPLAAHLLHRLTSGPGDYDARERAYFAFASRVTRLRVGGSYVFDLGYRSHDPRLAARVANALASAYLADRLDRERMRQEGFGAAYRVGRSEALGRELLAAHTAQAEGETPARDLYYAGARVLGPATPPRGKTFPKPAPTLMLCAVIAAITGAVATLMRAGRRPSVSYVARHGLLAESLD